jgi:hypothetical protein
MLMAFSIQVQGNFFDVSNCTAAVVVVQLEHIRIGIVRVFQDEHDNSNVTPGKNQQNVCWLRLATIVSRLQSVQILVSSLCYKPHRHHELMPRFTGRNGCTQPIRPAVSNLVSPLDKGGVQRDRSLSR